VPGLLDALKDPEAIVRSSAADALRKIGPNAAVPAFLNALKTTILSGWQAYALSEIGPSAAEAVPALLDVLKDSAHIVRLHAADALASIRA
jgi:HEAT repeat protein